jgi:putative SOS response-associated peptidase YedK
MCTRYVSPSQAAIERYWQLRPGQVPIFPPPNLFPRAPGAFIRRAVHEVEPARELVIGQWALIPHFAKEPKLPYSTNNARFEELAAKASYKAPWAKGQRCIIPATSFDEPCWETGKNVWWRFVRRDGAPWGLAGLWNAWTDFRTGEVHESYTVLTVNADAHPLMRRMHRPDPKFGPDEQDKRSVVAVELADVDQWLYGTAQEASALVQAPPAELIEAGPVGGAPGAEPRPL